MKYCPYCGADIPDGAVSFCAECGKAYNDGYDGYYEDLLPVDHGRERFETNPAPVKKIIVLVVGVLVVIGLCVLILHFV